MIDWNDHAPRGSILVFFLLLLLTPVSARASGVLAALEGRVMDPEQGRPLAGARLLLQAAESHRSLETRTDGRGDFRFPVLEPGQYRLRVEAPGFFPFQQQVLLRPRQQLRVEVQLHLRRSRRDYVEVAASRGEFQPDRTSSARLFTHQMLARLPEPQRHDLMTLARHALPGAVLGHDNFVHVRGNELSLHQFINGVSFLDNPHSHFSAALSPSIFESVNFISGGFAPEFGNRFGGILDLTTRSGATLAGHGSASVGVGTGLHHDASLEYGNSLGRWGYYFFLSGMESGRFLNPPTQREIHDLGRGAQAVVQIDYQGRDNLVKLFLTGSGNNFELPNTVAEAEAGRDAFRRIRSQTAILTWQHLFSPTTLVSTSLYERNVSDRLLGTSDPVTPLGEGSRSTQTTGIKTDLSLARGRHTIKAGLDLSLFRLRESFRFDDRDRLLGGKMAAPPRAAGLPSPSPRFSSTGVDSFDFRGRDLGGQFGLYLQDRFSPVPRVTLEAGLRWDQLNLVGSDHQVSPRLALSYRAARNTVVRFSYDRLFTPPPLEWVVLASFLGRQPMGPGRVHPYIQDYYELGWSQRLHPKLTLEVAAYHHVGRNSFENSEIANTRLFVPTNFHKARSTGLEVSLDLQQLERTGLSGRLQYALSRTHFFGPVSGGLGAEELAPGEGILPAFDQTHTGSAEIFYRNPWHRFRSGFNFRYGSGTPAELPVDGAGISTTRVLRLAGHFTADFSAGIRLWQLEERSLDFEFNLTNLSSNTYGIAKESEVTPIQFAPRRVVSGRLTWHF